MQIRMPSKLTFAGFNSGVFTKRQAVLSKADITLLKRCEKLMDTISAAYYDEDDERRMDIVLASGILQELADAGRHDLDERIDS